LHENSKDESVSSHINTFKALIQLRVEVGEKIEEDEAMAILLNNLPTKYDNIVFPVSNMPSQFLGTMVSTLSTLMANENGETDDEEKSSFSNGKNKSREREGNNST
jgi:stress response protein SCP2